jgi:hypothetical protein
MNLKIAEALRTMAMHGGVLLRGQWWPISPKLVFDHTATPDEKIMDNSGMAVLKLDIEPYGCLGNITRDLNRTLGSQCN